MSANQAQTLTAYRLILASTSPRRRELLSSLGIPFEIIPPGFAGSIPEIDETPLPGETPVALVQRLSQAKATVVADHLPLLRSTTTPDEERHPIVIGADTVVALEDQILGKPATPALAAQMLEQLRSRPHEVYSGVTIARPAGETHFVTRAHQSRVWMRPYTDAEIAAYVATGAPLDKAGAYGIQDQPFSPVERFEGCFASIMGLPLAELALALAQVGVVLPPVGPACTRYNGSPCCQLGEARYP